MAKQETDKKSHYRKVFKSDHLGSADLEDLMEEKKPLTFTISHVKQEFGTAVAGKKGNFNIAYFVQSIKPLVLNATNSKTVKALAGGSPFVEDWKNVVVELYIDHSVKMKGEIVGGVRIKQGVAQTLPPLTKDQKESWQKVVDYMKDGGTFENVEKRFFLSEEIKSEILTEVKTA